MTVFYWVGMVDHSYVNLFQSFVDHTNLDSEAKRLIVWYGGDEVAYHEVIEKRAVDRSNKPPKERKIP